MYNITIFLISCVYTERCAWHQCAEQTKCLYADILVSHLALELDSDKVIRQIIQRKQDIRIHFIQLLRGNCYGTYAVIVMFSWISFALEVPKSLILARVKSVMSTSEQGRGGSKHGS